ncbi:MULTISPECIES: hypothetical protein [unclassified Caballeronia]|uniref:hypothetical protein n=1 Tax=unclassified Caballeronia TaxID=2646786 RepID=UPI002865B7F6|nr:MULTISPECIES: hypothetical protein [unclassified Caballeronia]MDR5770869.1 hypothetical protein [Caballeronia sp. LZ002]MDR5846306.1 hypothetical protein [Caballeronia sp. LZ003]
MAEKLDTKEIAFRIDSAAGEFAHAASCFGSLATLFEAIIAATEDHSLAHRLAKLGENMCVEYDDAYMTLRDDYCAHAERYGSTMRHSEKEDA